MMLVSGFRITGAHLILEIDTEVAPYVSLIFQWAMDGIPLQRIAEHLTSLQAPTYQRLVHTRRKGHTRRSGSEAWSYTSVSLVIGVLLFQTAVHYKLFKQVCKFPAYVYVVLK